MPAKRARDPTLTFASILSVSNDRKQRAYNEENVDPNCTLTDHNAIDCPAFDPVALQQALAQMTSESDSSEDTLSATTRTNERIETGEYYL